jgi:hypothetical protein
MSRLFLRTFSALGLAATALSALSAQNPQGVPEAPAIWREVAGVINSGVPGAPAPSFQRAHIPAYRTTADGRVGMIVEGNNARFGLITPEKLTAPVLLETNLIGTINPTTMFAPSPAINWAPTAGWTWMHTTVWDDPAWPQAQGARDRYVFDVVATARNSSSHTTSEIRFFATRVELLVDNPKTASASIFSVTALSQSSGASLTGPIDLMGNTAPYHGWAFEPTIAVNGRLMVVRIASPDMTWTDPAGGTPQITPQHVDIVYSWSDVPNEPVNPLNWSKFFPIALAPYDPRINTTVGFAFEPFRDPSGAPILNPSAPALDSSADIGGSYPWIDRAGSNLFMETIADRLAPNGDLSKLTTALGARYNNSIHPSDLTATTVGTEDGGMHQGICVVGKWTQGKIIQIDNLNNDTDYAVGMGDGDPNYGPQHRVVDLYQPGTLTSWSSPPPSWSSPALGKLLLAYGRSTKYMPAWENDNGNIIDSLENKLNYKRHATTLAYRDVVWHLNNCKQTDELVFDDYMDPDAFIVSNMTGLLVHTDAPLGGGGSTLHQPYFKHHTGWNESTKQFSSAPRLQNAAAPKPTRWAVPSYGQVVGQLPPPPARAVPTGRIEPAAAGGVHGKGFWLDGANGIEYAIPTQPNDPSFESHDWYVGLFLDTRGTEDAEAVRILRFPDGTELWMDGRAQFQFKNASGQIVHRIHVPAPLGTGSMLSDLVPDGGWCHVALQIHDQGRSVDFYLNGLPYSRWESNVSGIFQVGVGTLLVGASAQHPAGFRGWIDDFKVLAHTVDLESACNHAGGTLIGLADSYTGVWKTDFADRYPAWVHARISDALRANGENTYGSYACFYDYRGDYGVHRESVAALTANGDVSHLRSAIHFPEGPRFSNRPRPDSLTNKFCLSCHHGQGDPGLDLIPLAPFAINAPQDPRRQPSDPPGLLFGNIPAGLVDTTGLPSTSIVAPSTGVFVDNYRFPRFFGPANVMSVTLVDDTSGEDLMDLPLSASGPLVNPPVLDPVLLGTVDISLRINLDHGQDSVKVALNAGTATIPLHPYLFDLPLSALNLSGPNVVAITPLGGATMTTGFQIVSLASIRSIANYRADYQANAPKEDWLYGWNANGVVTNADSFRSMNWFSTGNRYTDKGLAFPESSSELHFGTLDGLNGHPGQGVNQGAAHDRFAMVGYRVKWPGKYVAFGSATVGGSSTGIETRVLAQTGANNALAPLATVIGTGAVPIDNSLAVATLAVGDILWVAIGPNGHANFDGFALDYEILYVP